MAMLLRVAHEFADTFPCTDLDRARLKALLRTIDRPPYAADQFAKSAAQLVEVLLVNPPVRDMLIPFIQALLVELGRVSGLGLDRSEREAHRIVCEIARTSDTPLAGLTVAIAAPRSAAGIDVLARLEPLIADIHDLCRREWAVSVGPREHHTSRPDPVSDSWEGQHTDACQTTVHHDVLVAFALASTGTGEAVAVAKSLDIPVIPVRLKRARGADDGDLFATDPAVAHGDTEVLTSSLADYRPSCRLEPDGDLILDPVEESGDAPIADQVRAALLRASELARRRQRARIVRAINETPYRQYLVSRNQPPRLPTWISDALSDPLRFMTLAPLVRVRAARRLGALDPEPYEAFKAMDEPGRDGFRAYVSSLDPPLDTDAQGRLLQYAGRALVHQGTNGKHDRSAKLHLPDHWERVHMQMLDRGLM